MGCNRSIVRVGPAHKGQAGKDRKTVSHFQQARQNMWRRMVRFGVVKVKPAKFGGGDNPVYEARGPVQPESVLYTDNKPATGPGSGLLANKCIKTAWGEVNPAQAKILLELQANGIVSFNTTPSGAISFSVGDQTGDGGALPPRRPPARLARLERVPSLPDSKKAEDLKKKMKAAETRRKKKQDNLKERLLAHSRLGQHHHDAATEADRAWKEQAAVKIAGKQAAFQDRMDELTEARQKRAMAGEYARELVKETGELARFEAAETVIKKQERVEAHMQQQEVERMDRIRAKSRMEEHAKEVAQDMVKKSQDKTAETVAKKQKIVESNIQRRERFRTQRVLLNERHRENIRRALARRLAEEEDGAECDMDYEIETAQDSGDEDEDFFEPELKWHM